MQDLSAAVTRKPGILLEALALDSMNGGDRRNVTVAANKMQVWMAKPCLLAVGTE